MRGPLVEHVRSHLLDVDSLWAGGGGGTKGEVGAGGRVGMDGTRSQNEGMAPKIRNLPPTFPPSFLSPLSPLLSLYL